MRDQSSGFDKGSIYQRIIRGVSANIIGQILNVLNKLALVPLFIGSWGAEKYGEWLLINSIVSYLALTEMGGTHYIVNKLTQLYTKKNQNGFDKTLKTGLILFIIIPILILALILILITCVPLQNFFSVSNINNDEFNILLVLLAVQVCLSLPVGLILGVYRAIGKYTLSVMYSNFVQLLQLLIVSAALLSGLGLISIAVAQATPILIIGIISAIFLYNKLNNPNLLVFNDIKIVDLKKLIVPSFNFFIIQMSQLFVQQGTILIIAKVLGPVEVVIFSTVRTIANIIRQILGMIINSSKPEITRLDVMHNNNQLTELFNKITKITILLGVFVGIFTHLFGTKVYKIWLDGTMLIDPLFLNLFVLYIIILIFWFSYADFLMAVNNHKLLSFVLLLGSIINVFFCFFGASLFDLNGAVIGLIISDLLFAAWLVPRIAFLYKPIINRKGVIFNILLVMLYIINIMFNSLVLGITSVLLLLYLLFYKTKIKSLKSLKY